MKSKKPSYKGTQQNLYSLARKAWAYCLLYILDFALRDKDYTADLVAAQLKLVDGAEALPDYENRKEIPAETYEDMQKARVALLNEWQFLKGYTLDSFPDSLLKVKLEAAGQGHYKKAMGGGLDSTVAIFNAANTFMTSNMATLTNKGNMPADFPSSFKTLGDNFKALRNIYDGKTDSVDVQTANKDIADAAILKGLKPMLRLGARVFKKDEAKRVKFIYDRLLDEVRGNSDAGLKGIFTNADTKKPIEGVRIRAIDTNYETISDKDGRFFLALASGEYTVEITAPGYETMTFYKRKIEIGMKHRFSQVLVPAPVASMNAPINSMLSDMLKDVPVENGVHV